MERRIERPLLDPQDLGRGLDVRGDGVAVQRPASGEDLEDQDGQERPVMHRCEPYIDFLVSGLKIDPTPRRVQGRNGVKVRGGPGRQWASGFRPIKPLPNSA